MVFYLYLVLFAFLTASHPSEGHAWRREGKQIGGVHSAGRRGRMVGLPRDPAGLAGGVLCTCCPQRLEASWSLQSCVLAASFPQAWASVPSLQTLVSDLSALHIRNTAPARLCEWMVHTAAQVLTARRSVLLFTVSHLHVDLFLLVRF